MGQITESGTVVQGLKMDQLERIRIKRGYFNCFMRWGYILLGGGICGGTYYEVGVPSRCG